MPRTQGRPPHCWGFTVIRSKTCAINSPLKKEIYHKWRE
jgi:hypothetical protein